MNYDHIENLVTKAKLGDTEAKEMLVKEFTPFIINLSKKSFINSYEFADVKNECYKTLFKCLGLYNSDRHRFVAYATNAIKNTVNHLIRTSVRRDGAEGKDAFVLDDKLESVLYSEIELPDDIFINQADRLSLMAALNNLETSERERINYVYFKGYSLKKYAQLKGIPYSTVASRKAAILNKLKRALKHTIEDTYLN